MSPAGRWCSNGCKDYWGKDLPNSIGQDNFDELRYEFFRDDVVGRQAFKADQFDWYAERSAKEWSVAYDFPAVHDGRVIKEKFPVRSSGRMQGWAFNLRRPLFKDVAAAPRLQLRIRFRGDEPELSTGEYHRDSSYFDGIPDFMATGLPEGLELEMLEPCATRCLRRFSRRPTRIPSAATPKPSATICAKRRGC